MFDNIGSKIKSLAKVVTWIGIIGSVIAGIVTMAADSDNGWIGLIIIPVGILVSWISSFILYGFGELVDNSAKIAKSLQKPLSANEKLIQLEEWRKKGLITEDDYNEQRKQNDGETHEE